MKKLCYELAWITLPVMFLLDRGVGFLLRVYRVVLWKGEYNVSQEAYKTLASIEKQRRTTGSHE